jgi:DNA-damage-inducible protein J
MLLQMQTGKRLGPYMKTIADTSIRARIDSETKEKAASALKAMGLSVSDAIRLLMRRIADEEKMPFEIKVPNKETQEALRDLTEGRGTIVSSVDEMWTVLVEKD